MEIERFTSVPNGQGGYTQEWTVIAQINGTIDMLQGGINTDQQKVKEDSTHILIVIGTLDIKQGDRVRAFDKAYDVQYVDDPLNMGHHLEIELKVRG
ncbi:phage head closure protein [Salipaludibacillus agaradhaerens]|uniref:Phage head closure protein n=1 Tax=Salipaludibacillus agaradhaerens TaxID=76935 RepID=A0A9Q4FZ01_SALAG|nr:phage head closure protein [Salipaludibacillus agaradhaerens]MCR6096856.1 phage head closure protein [Salipaludibacillus agaradhaerens]MCR6116700.1 phage head closure protein [Salipaludibacillus agaradhaerens]